MHIYYIVRKLVQHTGDGVWLKESKRCRELNKEADIVSKRLRTTLFHRMRAQWSRASPSASGGGAVEPSCASLPQLHIYSTERFSSARSTATATIPF